MRPSAASSWLSGAVCVYHGGECKHRGDSKGHSQTRKSTTLCPIEQITEEPRAGNMAPNPQSFACINRPTRYGAE